MYASGAIAAPEVEKRTRLSEFTEAAPRTSLLTFLPHRVKTFQVSCHPCDAAPARNILPPHLQVWVQLRLRALNHFENLQPNCEHRRGEHDHIARQVHIQAGHYRGLFVSL